MPAGEPSHPGRPPRRSGAFAALYHRNFRLFFTGQLVSLVGTWMQQIALSWLVLDLTDSAWYVGLVNALEGLPVLLLALYAGVVADRVSRLRLVFTTQAAAMVLALALAALVLAQRATIAPILVIATLVGVVNAFDIPGRHTLFGDLVGRDDLISAVALNSSAFNATRIVGPAIAGVILGWAGAGWCFLVNGVSYLAVLASLRAMHVEPARRVAEPVSSVGQHMASGLRHIWAEPTMRGIILLLAGLSVFGAPFLVLLPIVARDVLHRGSVEYGWMMTAVGAGALTGALWIATYARRLVRGRVLLWSAAAFGALVMSLGSVQSVIPTLGLLTGLGFAMIVNGAASNTLLQSLAPEGLRGRVVSVYTLVAVGLAPLGAVQAGAIAQRWGAPTALALGGAVCLVGVGLAAYRIPELRATR